jgi:hypothetical protein
MTKSIKKLREDLDILEKTIIGVRQELEEVYGQYLNHLGKVVIRQLILATYHICTQKYPESFLKLSFQDRHNLQQRIKNLENIFNKQLKSYLLAIDFYQPTNLHLQTFFLGEESSNNTPNKVENIGNNNQENQPFLTNKNINIGEKEEESLEKSAPEQLTRFSLEIDLSIHNTLQEISQIANQDLQKLNILPNKLPSKILEMALQSEENASGMIGQPNLLNLLVEREMGKDKETEPRDITPITAICLRLSEIEFADSTLTSLRNKLREVFAKIEKITNQYRQKQHNYAIAQAQLAWRSSWFED